MGGSPPYPPLVQLCKFCTLQRPPRVDKITNIVILSIAKCSNKQNTDRGRGGGGGAVAFSGFVVNAGVWVDQDLAPLTQNVIFQSYRPQDSTEENNCTGIQRTIGGGGAGAAKPDQNHHEADRQ
jgi:hypothetical protein